MMLIFGDMLDALTASDKVADAARPVAYRFLMLGAGVFVSGYIATYCFTCAGKSPRPSHLHPILPDDKSCVSPSRTATIFPGTCRNARSCHRRRADVYICVCIFHA
jgi:hypothetical protein